MSKKEKSQKKKTKTKKKDKVDKVEILCEDVTPLPVELAKPEELELDPKRFLVHKELEILEKYEREDLLEDPRRTLAANTANSFYQLFLQGHTVDEIYNLNKSFPKGMILHARVKFKWDEERHKYMVGMFSKVRERMIQSQAESILFLADMIAAAHKNMGERLRRYIQTGDEKLVKDINIGSIHNYGRAIALLAKLTGQEKNLGSLKVFLEESNSNQQPVVIEGAATTSETQKALPTRVAADIVKELVKRDEKKNG